MVDAVRPDVALISPYPARGRTHRGYIGVATYTANLARALSARGAGVVVVGPAGASAEPGYSDEGVTVVPSGPPGAHALVRAIQAAAERRPGVIHLQHEMFLFGGSSSIATLPLAMRLLRGYERAITTVHQVVDPRTVSRELMAMHRFAGPLSAARTGIKAYQSMIASVGVTVVHESGFARQFPDSVVIPHGVESRKRQGRAEARHRLGLSREKRLVVLCFGFVAPYKGLEPVLAAASSLADVLVVVAGGDHPRHGARYTRSLQSRWGRSARFTGWVPDEDVSAWHAAADLAVFAYPDPHSSSGAVAMALGHGTPFLASEPLARCMNLPRQASVSLDGIELGQRLGSLAANRDLLADLNAACAAVSKGRSWAEVAGRHLQLYERVGSEGTREPPLPVAPGSRGQVEVA